MSPPDINDLEHLAARVRAEEPNSRLDEDIAIMIGMPYDYDEEGQFGGYRIFPRRLRFTRSVDAALLLAERLAPNHRLILEDHGGTSDLKWCCILSVRVQVSKAKGPTAAAAITIAALLTNQELIKKRPS